MAGSTRLRLWLKGISFVGFTALLLFLWQASVFRLTENFYEVDPGKFYRSAQLTEHELKDVIQKYGIKTVVSLRGAPRNSYWVPIQEKILSELGVKFVALQWTNDFFPHKDDLVGYEKVLENAERPILVHCRTGADRTGEATALYAIEYMNETRDEAIQKHLNWKYWHIQASHPAKSEFVRQYQGREWALTKYDHCSPEFRNWVEPGFCP